MRYFVRLISVLALLGIPLSFGQGVSPSGIYDSDDRRDVSEIQDPLVQKISQSVAAMMEAESLVSRNGRIFFAGQTLAQEEKVCPEERFANQLSIAECSGFLVAPDRIVTAGHCVPDQKSCESLKWVFDFRQDHMAIGIDPDNVYSCAKLVVTVDDPRSWDDFAVIQLDRRVRHRKPLPYRRRGEVSIGTSVAALGFPSGLPMKFADHAQVVPNDPSDSGASFFSTNLDVFGGNSGSVVFATRTGLVEGILVRTGDVEDYTLDPERGCYHAQKSDGSSDWIVEVTRITRLKLPIYR